MRMRRIGIPIALLAASVALGAAAFASHDRATANLRPTNVELRIFSQSCFQGEIEPCG